MPEGGFLALEDGAVFRGQPFGAPERAHGEVVFTTAMTGYQEVLTDPSFAGQIVVMTYPLIGNYGLNPYDEESRGVQVRGFVVREACESPSHWQAQATLHEYLLARGIPGLAGLDTRALTRRLRSRGVMMGALAFGEDPARVLELLRQLPRYEESDYVRAVSTQESYTWDNGAGDAEGPHIAVLDLGVKYNILRLLRRRGCTVTALPCDVSAEDILALAPQGVVLSPGPGDPALLDRQLETVRGLLGKVPIMGICLGHQIVGRVFGGRTFKLKFGHRGANHPVKDLVSGRVHITSQNHGFAVDPEGLNGGVAVSHLHLNDGTVEGLAHPELGVLTIQYHSEASPGPRDNEYLFDRFLDTVRAWARTCG